MPGGAVRAAAAAARAAARRPGSGAARQLRDCGSGAPAAAAAAAPRRARRGVELGGVFGGVAAGAEQVATAPRTPEEAATTQFTADEFEQRMKRTAENFGSQAAAGALDPEAPDADAVLQKSFRRFQETDAQQTRIADQDGLFNASPSGIKAEPVRASKVFWKRVDVVQLDDTWWGLELDGRRVKSWESEDYLVVPGEEFALAIAEEFGQQKEVVNRFLMPLMDVASGAHQVSPDGIHNRSAYLLEFFKHDHLYFREENVRKEQTELCDPILEWADRFFDIETPRVEGIARPVIAPADLEKMRAALEGMALNKYQVVALTVLAQYTSSLILPLAVVNRAVTLEHALRVNRIEDEHNIRTAKEIKGYHDIRDADVVVKVSACWCAWLFTRHVSQQDCFPPHKLLGRQ